MKNIGSPEERLHTVMTKAKEKGMPTEKIFSYFNGGNPNTTEITKQSFLEALERLGNSLVVMTDDELTKLVNNFDVNSNGTISLVEFRNYCFHCIPSIAWKAERQRLEQNGELRKLQAQLSRQFSGKVQPKDKHSSGEMVHHTSKLFWRSNTSLDIRLYCCHKLDVITMHMHKTSTGEELPVIYVCKNRCEVGNKELDRCVTSAVQMSDTRSGEEEERVKKEAHWGFVSKYLVARLKIENNSGLMAIPSSRNLLANVEVGDNPIQSDPLEASCLAYLCKLAGKS